MCPKTTVVSILALPVSSSVGFLNAFLVKCLKLGLWLTHTQDSFLFYSTT